MSNYKISKNLIDLIFILFFLIILIFILNQLIIYYNNYSLIEINNFENNVNKINIRKEKILEICKEEIKELKITKQKQDFEKITIICCLIACCSIIYYVWE